MSNWLQIGNDINGGYAGSKLGWSVSLSDSGDVVAIGAPYDTVAVYGGYVNIYKLNGSTWDKHEISRGWSVNARNGYSVSLNGDGNRVAVGEPGRKSTKVYYLNEEENGYGILTGGGINEPDSDFGFSVSLSSDGAVAIGAQHKVFVY